MRKRKIMLILSTILLLSISCTLTQCSSAQDRYRDDGLPELRSIEEQTQDAGTARAEEEAATKTAQAKTDAAPPATEEPQDTEPTIPPKTQTAIALEEAGFFADETGDGLDCKTGEYASAETPPWLDITRVKGAFNEEKQSYLFEFGFGQVAELNEEFSVIVALRNPFRQEVEDADLFPDNLGNNRFTVRHILGDDPQVTRSRVTSQEEGWQEVPDTAATGSVEGDAVRLEVPLEEVAPENEGDDMNFFSFFAISKDTDVCDAMGEDSPWPLSLPVPEGYTAP